MDPAINAAADGDGVGEQQRNYAQRVDGVQSHVRADIDERQQRADDDRDKYGADGDVPARRDMR